MAGVSRCQGLLCGRAIAGFFSCGCFCGFLGGSLAGSPRLQSSDVVQCLLCWPLLTISPHRSSPLSELAADSFPWDPHLTPQETCTVSPIGGRHATCVRDPTPPPFWGYSSQILVFRFFQKRTIHHPHIPRSLRNTYQILEVPSLGFEEGNRAHPVH